MLKIFVTNLNKQRKEPYFNLKKCKLKCHLKENQLLYKREAL